MELGDYGAITSLLVSQSGETLMEQYPEGDAGTPPSKTHVTLAQDAHDLSDRLVERVRALAGRYGCVRGRT